MVTRYERGWCFILVTTELKNIENNIQMYSTLCFEHNIADNPSKIILKTDVRG